MSRDNPTQHPPFEDPEDPIVESLEIGLGRRGKPLDKWLTRRDLKNIGFLSVDESGEVSGLGPLFVGGGSGGDGFADDGGGGLDFGEDDLSIPPAPTNVRARGISLDAIGVTWNPSPASNHAYAEIFASQSPFWSSIRDGFNAERPIEPGNSSPNFMGRASGTIFLHRGLSNTVPTIDLSAEVAEFNDASPGTFVVVTGVDPSEFFVVGETAFLTAPGAWEGNGISGTVLGFSGAAVQMDFEFDDEDVPAGALLVRVPDPDGLDAALNPTPVYYWVRFVSTAGIVGPVQSEEGAVGTVMINPETVLNLLTGRIRRTNLAGDLVTPINWISGPIGEFDSVREFVEALGDEAVSEFSETLWEEFIGLSTPQEATAGAAFSIIRGELDEFGGFVEQLNEIQIASEQTSSFPELMALISQRALVSLRDGDALAYLADNLQVEVGDETIVFNEIGQRIHANEESIESAITLRVQANTGGIWTAAGFGISLQGDPNNPGELTSSVIFAADQFAIMSEASGGRMILNVRDQPGDTRYRVTLEGGADTSSELDGMITGSRVAFALGPNAPSNLRNAFRGQAFVVTSRSVAGGDIVIIIEHPDGDDVPNIGNNNVAGDGYALFTEQSIPFIVDTLTGTVGIRGRLIVDGLISADNLEINELIRSNEIWTEDLTVFGLANANALVGQTIATGRFGGWAVRMQTPDASRPKVLEFGRWGNAQDDVDPEDVIGQQDLFPQLTVEPEESAFWVDSERGSAFIRGNLTVGGNARFWTGQGQGVGNWFVQMDQEFPIMILPKVDGIGGDQAPPFIRPGAVDGDDINYSESDRNYVRRHALFWTSKSGQAGFNTTNNAIFVNDTPLDPPNGLGDIEVKARLDSGAQTGLGRVHAMAVFDWKVNRVFPDWYMNTSVHMYLADVNTNYDDSPDTIPPTARNGLNGGPEILNPIFIDDHFLIIRSSDGGSNPGQGDPGLDAVLEWESRHPELIKMAQTGIIRTQQGVVHGTAVDAPAGDYKILIACIERFDTDGNPVFGPDGPKGYPFNGTIFAQQVSNTVGF